MSVRVGLAALAALWLAACSCESESESESESEGEGEVESEGQGQGQGEGESESESESEGESETCTLEASARILGPVASGRALSIAADEDGAVLVLADRDPTRLDAFLVPREGEPALATLEVADAGALFALEATSPTHFVALTLGQCTADGRAAPCVHALGLDTSSGRVVAHGARTLVLPAPLRSSRVIAASDSLYFAHAHQGAAPALERLTWQEGDLALVTTPLGQGDPSLADEPTEILGLTASGGGFGVLWRRGATEDAASAVVLTTQLDEHQIAALHDALVVESMAWLAGSLSIVVSLEFARPSYVRLGADGEMRSPPSTLRFGEEPPAPFAGRRVALVRGEPGALSIQIRDGAGDDVGPTVALPAAATRADAARTATGFAVATAEGADAPRTIALRSIRCP